MLIWLITLVWAIGAWGDDSARKLITQDGFYRDPRFSPDGQQIALIVGAVEGEVLALMDANGTNLRIVEGARVVNDVTEPPSWSPDGSRIAFAGRRAGSSRELYTIRSDGTDLRQITDHPGHESYPSWSPDGKSLVFSRQNAGEYNLYLLKIDEKNEEQITTPPYHLAVAPSWSPDGAKIAFSSATNISSSASYEIYTFDVASREITRLTDNDFFDAFPTWSPDGKKIAFSSGEHLENTDNRPEKENIEIYIMDIDGSNRVRVTYAGYEDFSPSWSPDGKYLLFDSRRGDTNRTAYLIEVPRSTTSVLPQSWGWIKNGAP